MPITLRVYRGLSIANAPPLALSNRLQEAVDHWPVDASKEHRDIRIFLEHRAHNVIRDFKVAEELEKEAASLERLTSNTYRDRYPLPQGLGGPPPVIGATGLDLASVSTVLANQGDSVTKKSLLSRILTFFL